MSFDSLDFDCAFLSSHDLPFQDPTPKEPKVCADRPIILLPLILSYSRTLVTVVRCTLCLLMILILQGLNGAIISGGSKRFCEL